MIEHRMSEINGLSNGLYLIEPLVNKLLGINDDPRLGDECL